MSDINFFATRSRFQKISSADGSSWDDAVGARVKKEAQRAAHAFNRELESYNATIEGITSKIDSLFSAIYN